MPGVGATVGNAAAGVAVAASRELAFCAEPTEGGAFGWAAAEVLGDELAGVCADAGVSQAAAKAIAHPIRFICTPGDYLEPETQVRAAEVSGSIGAGFRSLKRLACCNC